MCASRLGPDKIQPIGGFIRWVDKWLLSLAAMGDVISAWS